jgi:hypothetical protein
MVQLDVCVQVPDAVSKDASRIRIAGLAHENSTIVVASMKAGDTIADHEFSFLLGEGLQLAEACLSGNRHALTSPGLARKLSATVAILFRVSVQSGAIQQQGNIDDGDGLQPDRSKARGDEDPCK